MIIPMSVLFALTVLLVIWPCCCPGCDLQWKTDYEKMAQRTNDVVYAKDHTCGVWNAEKGAYEEPKLKLLDWDAMNSIKDFHDAVLGPLCGDPYYNNFKHCAMVQFFDNKLPEEVEWKEDNKDLLLIFVDGCAVCKNMNNKQKGEELKLNIQLKHTWPAGSLLTNCKEEEHEAGTYHTDGADMQDVARIFPKAGYTKEASHGTSFVVNGVLYQRICNTIFGPDEMSTSFQHIKLHVEHNCGDGKPFDVDLPDLITEEYKSHVVEMRGLWLDLDTGTAKLFDQHPDKFDYFPVLAWNNWNIAGQGNEYDEEEEEDY